MWFDETGLPWVPPSPNMPSLDTAVVYPGTYLIEGTNVSEGRGTTKPFELTGAPWIDEYELVEELRSLLIRGLSTVRLLLFLGGVSILVRSVVAFRFMLSIGMFFEPVKLGLGLVWIIKHFLSG